MNHPWRDIPLEVYEAHMSLEDVAQLQTLNSIIKRQFRAFSSSSAAILGVAGGNGLEHAGGNLKIIYGIDLNPEYLAVCAQRFRPLLGERLKLMELNLCEPSAVLPQVDLLIADLVIEYIGLELFCEKTAAANANYISCVIQHQDSTSEFVSKSVYEKAFQAIVPLHQTIQPEAFCSQLERRGYVFKCLERFPLPNKKELLRMDFEKRA